MKKRAGRPKGSKNKEVKSVAETAVEPINLTKIALNQVDQANAIKDLQMGMASLSQGLNNLVQNTNKVLTDLGKKIQASESRVSDVEKAVTKEEKPASEPESLT